jgi:hypothetical protein
VNEANEATEAELDALILRFGADYNRPSDFVPREEMWHEIRQRSAQQPSERRRSYISLLAAAVVLLAAGVGIGIRFDSRTASSPGSTTQANTKAPATSTSSPQVAVVPQVGGNDAENGAVARAAHPPTVAASATPRLRATDTYTNNDKVAQSNDAASPTAYSLATVRHFTAVEALLTSYQTSPHDAHGDAQMASWARALLSQTRLLLDSPAAKNPVRRKLLQDLELVLVQMTQLSPTETPIDRESIDGAVKHSDVLTRLRTAVPAGAATTL